MDKTINVSLKPAPSRTVTATIHQNGNMRNVVILDGRGNMVELSWFELTEIYKIGENG